MPNDLTMRCSEPGWCVTVAIVASRGPGRWVVRRRPARLGFLRASVSLWLFFSTTEAQRHREFCGSVAVGQISFRVFRVVRGYIPSAVTAPVVAAVLQSLAGDHMREDERHVAEQTGCSEPRDCVSVACSASLARGR
jgi:hypothetical protein